MRTEIEFCAIAIILDCGDSSPLCFLMLVGFAESQRRSLTCLARQEMKAVMNPRTPKVQDSN